MSQGILEKGRDPKWLADNVSTSQTGGGVLWILGFIFAILGIIADGIGSLGLTPMSWFMLAIVFHLAGLSYWISWAVGVYFRARG